MIRIIVYARDEIIKTVHEVLLRYAMRFSWLDYDFAAAKSQRDWEKWIQADQMADIMICDVSINDNVASLKAARKRHPQAIIVPVADLSIPAYRYVCPEIAPYSLIWKPPVLEQVSEVMSQIIRIFEPHQTADDGEKDYFLLETRQSVHRIPYDQIYYFEARDKKCYLRLKAEEYAFYDTLGQLADRLPANFIRCHKSFLVNTDHVETFDRKERQLVLGGGLLLPVSRSYYASVKEVITYG